MDDSAEIDSDQEENYPPHPPLLQLPPPNGEFLPRQSSTGRMTLFPAVEPQQPDTTPSPSSSLAWRHPLQKLSKHLRSSYRTLTTTLLTYAKTLFHTLPLPLQKFTRTTSHHLSLFLHGLWAFMNPPLWAMLTAIIVASIPSLQRLFFSPNTFINNSVTRAIEQSGNVAVPLILVVLGANLARNTLPTDKEASNNNNNNKSPARDGLREYPREERNLIIASLLARMLLPTLIMSPILALTAKFVPVSILDDPIFVIICFLLTGAPSALQLAQICQLNNVYMGAMARVLFQSYVVWYVSIFFISVYIYIYILVDDQLTKMIKMIGSSPPPSSSSCLLSKSSDGRRPHNHNYYFTDRA